MKIESINNLLSSLPRCVSEYAAAMMLSKQPRTVQAYLYDLTRINNICGLMDCTTADIINCANALDTTNAAKARLIAAAKSFYKWAYGRGIIKNNPAISIEAPKRHTHPITIIPNDELQAILRRLSNTTYNSPTKSHYAAATRLRNTAIIILLYTTGIRISELCNLRLSDIDRRTGAFVVTRKGGDRQRFYMPLNALHALNDYIQSRNDNCPHLFATVQLSPITPAAVQTMISKLCNDCNIPHYHPHDFRSTFGTNLYNKSRDIYIVAACMGHNSIDTTARYYAKLGDNHIREAMQGG